MLWMSIFEETCENPNNQKALITCNWFQQSSGQGCVLNWRLQTETVGPEAS